MGVFASSSKGKKVQGRFGLYVCVERRSILFYSIPFYSTPLQFLSTCKLKSKVHRKTSLILPSSSRSLVVSLENARVRNST